MTDEPFEVADPSGLSDADWADINRLRQAYKTGGKDALSEVLEELAQDPIRYIRVIGAIFSDVIREAIKDEMADLGIDEEDLRAVLRKIGSPARKQ